MILSHYSFTHYLTHHSLSLSSIFHNNLRSWCYCPICLSVHPSNSLWRERGLWVICLLLWSKEKHFGGKKKTSSVPDALSQVIKPPMFAHTTFQREVNRRGLINCSLCFPYVLDLKPCLWYLSEVFCYSIVQKHEYICELSVPLSGSLGWTCLICLHLLKGVFCLCLQRSTYNTAFYPLKFFHALSLKRLQLTV